MQAGSLHHSFPARSAPSGWDRQAGKKRAQPDGERPGGPDEMQRPRKTVDPGLDGWLDARLERHLALVRCDSARLDVLNEVARDDVIVDVPELWFLVGAT